MARTNSERDWSLFGHGNCKLLVTEKTVFLNGGVRLKNQSSYSPFPKLLALKKDSLTPLNLTGLSNSISKRDWQRRPLSELQPAIDFGEGVRVVFILDDQVYVQRIPWETRKDQMRPAEKTVYRVAKSKLEPVMNFENRPASLFADGEFIQYIPDGPVHVIKRGSDLGKKAHHGEQIKISRIALKNGDPHIEPPHQWSFQSKFPTSFRYWGSQLLAFENLPQAEASKWRTKKASLLSPGERNPTSTTEHRFSIEYRTRDPYHDANLLFTDEAENLYFFNRKQSQPVSSVDLRADQTPIRVVNATTGIAERKIVAPENTIFLGNPNFQSDYSILILAAQFREEENQDAPQQKQLVILKIPADSLEFQTVCEIPEAIPYVSIGKNNIVADQTHLYFTGLLPKPLQNSGINYRNGNFALYRYPLNFETPKSK